MSNLIKLVKLDGRYALSRWFTHRVEFSGNYRNPVYSNYWRLLKGLTEAHGAGMPLQAVPFFARDKSDQVTIWAHGTMSNGDPVIYLRDASLTDFIILRERYEKLVES